MTTKFNNNATLKNLRASSYSNTFVGENQYVKSILEPSKNLAHIPDLNLSPTILKQIHFDETITAGAIKEFLLWWPYYNRSSPLMLYGKYELDGKYYWMRNLKPNEDLADNFCSGRPVSGRVDIFSDTVSSGSFELGGTISGACVREAAPLNEMDYLSLTSYSENSLDYVLSKSLAEGVTALMKPTGESRFMPFETNAVSGTDFVTDLEKLESKTLGATSVYFPYDVSKYNFTGKTTMTLNIYTEIARTQVSMRVVYNKLNDAGVLTEEGEMRHWFGGVGSATYTDSWYTPCPISKVEFWVTPTSTSNFTSKLTISNHNMYSNNAIRPSTLLAVRGLTSNQTIKITGVMNYEVVPDSDLALNLKEEERVGNPKDFYVAQYMILHQKDFGLKFLCSRTEYQMMIRSNSHVVRRDGDLYAAAIDTLYPIIKNAGQFATPLISSGMDALIPGSGIVGNTAGRFMFGGSPKNPNFGDIPQFSFSEALKQAFNILKGQPEGARTYAFYLANEFKKQLGATPVEIPLSNENDLIIEMDNEKDFKLLTGLNEMLGKKNEEINVRVEDLARIHRSLILSGDPRTSKFEEKYKSIIKFRNGLMEEEKCRKTFQELVKLYNGKDLMASSSDANLELLKKFMSENNINMSDLKSMFSSSSVPEEAVPMSVANAKNVWTNEGFVIELMPDEMPVMIEEKTPNRMLPDTNMVRNFIDGFRNASGKCNIVLYDSSTNKGVPGWIMMSPILNSSSSKPVKMIKKRIYGQGDLNIYCFGSTLSLCRRLAPVLRHWNFFGDIFVQTSFDQKIKGEILDESIDIPFLLCAIGLDVPASIYITGATDIEKIISSEEIILPVKEVAKIDEKIAAIGSNILLAPGPNNLSQMSAHNFFNYGSLAELIGLQWMHKSNASVDLIALSSIDINFDFEFRKKMGDEYHLLGKTTISEVIEWLKTHSLITEEESNAFESKAWTEKNLQGFREQAENKFRKYMWDKDDWPEFLRRLKIRDAESKQIENEKKQANVVGTSIKYEVSDADAAASISKSFRLISELNHYANNENENGRAVKLIVWMIKNRFLNNSSLSDHIIKRMQELSKRYPGIMTRKGNLENAANAAKQIPGNLKISDIIALVNEYSAKMSNTDKGKNIQKSEAFKEGFGGSVEEPLLKESYNKIVTEEFKGKSKAMNPPRKNLPPLPPQKKNKEEEELIQGEKIDPNDY